MYESFRATAEQPYPYLINCRTGELIPGSFTHLVNRKDPGYDSMVRPIRADEWAAFLRAGADAVRSMVLGEESAQQSVMIDIVKPDGDATDEELELALARSQALRAGAQVTPQARAQLDVQLGRIDGTTGEVSVPAQAAEAQPPSGDALPLAEVLEAVDALDPAELDAHVAQAGIKVAANASVEARRAKLKQHIARNYPAQPVAAAG